MRPTNSALPTVEPSATEAMTCPRRMDRRAFLRDTALAVAAALMATALAPTEGFAESVSAMVPLSANGRTRTYPIPVADGVQVDLTDSVVLARWQGVLYAFSLECPHRGANLQWREGEQRLYCPKHKARFTANGAHASGRQTRDLDRFALTRTGSQVVVVLDQRLSSDTDAAAWRAAPLRL